MDRHGVRAGLAAAPPVYRSNPSGRAMDAAVSVYCAGDHAVAPDPAMAAADPGAAHDRSGSIRLWPHAYQPLSRRSEIRSRQGRDRDRAADLSDDWLYRIARAGGARRDVDRCDGAPARRPALAALAPAGLCDRVARSRALLHAVEARSVGADDHRR